MPSKLIGRSWNVKNLMIGNSTVFLAFVLCSAGSLLSCVHVRPVDSATDVDAHRVEGVSLEDASLPHQVPNTDSDALGVSPDWYEALDRPRILVLINRRFAGDSQKWRADGRVVVELEGVQGHAGGGAWTTRRGRVVVKEDQRQRVGATLLTPLDESEIRSGLVGPLVKAGAIIVDADAVDRISESLASRTDSKDSLRSADDLAAQAYLKEADWILEVIAVPADSRVERFILLGKIMDLSSRSLLAVASAVDAGGGGLLPGAEPLPRGLSAREQAAWLLRDLIGQALGHER